MGVWWSAAGNPLLVAAPNRSLWERNNELSSCGPGPAWSSSRARAKFIWRGMWIALCVRKPKDHLSHVIGGLSATRGAVSMTIFLQCPNKRSLTRSRLMTWLLNLRWLLTRRLRHSKFWIPLHGHEKCDKHWESVSELEGKLPACYCVRRHRSLAVSW